MDKIELSDWGLEFAFEETSAGMTFVVGSPAHRAAAGVRVDADGDVSVVETLTLDDDGFGGRDPETDRLAMLGLLSPDRPEADWGRWRRGRVVSERDDPAWPAILWSLCLVGDASKAPPSSRLADAARRLGGARMAKRLAEVGVNPDVGRGLPYPMPGLASTVALRDREEAAARRAALSAYPLFARTIATNAHLLSAVDEGKNVAWSLADPSLWGIGCAAYRDEPLFPTKGIVELGGLPYPPLAAISVLVSTVSVLKPGWRPLDEGGFRSMEILAQAVSAMPSFRPDFYRGLTGRPHDMAALLGPARGRWSLYMKRVATAAGLGREMAALPVDLSTAPTRRQAALASGLGRILRRVPDAGDAFAREVLAPSIAVDVGAIGTSAADDEAWATFGCSALFGGLGLFQVVTGWRRWVSGAHRPGLEAGVAKARWPVPDPVVRGRFRAEPLGSAADLFGKRACGSPLSGRVLDCASGRVLLVEVSRGGPATSLAAFDVRGRPDGGAAELDLLWHEGSGKECPPDRDMAFLSQAAKSIGRQDTQSDAHWSRWAHHVDTRHGPYAWAARVAGFRPDVVGLRAIALERWRDLVPARLRGCRVEDVQDRFAPEVGAALRHLWAAGSLAYPHWQRSVSRVLKDG